MPIAAVVITKNEERNIAECLQALRWVHDLIVVDACSTDRTVEIAREYTPRVFIRPWPGFGPQKNYGIDRATADWIFVIDADERVSPALRTQIESVTARWASNDPVAYRIPRRNFYYGRFLQRGGLAPDYQIRLFRREAARYNDVLVHENLLVNGPIGTLTGHLDHYTEREIADHFKKFGLYTTLAAKEKLKSTLTVGWTDIMLRPLVIWLKTYVAKQAYREGVHGLIVSVFASMYTFVKYVKLWDAIRQSRSPERV